LYLWGCHFLAIENNMKITLRLLGALLCVCLGVYPALSQPILTQSNHFPASEGLRYTRYKCDTTNIMPGSSGEAMLWDFSQLALSGVFIDAGTYVLPTQTQYSGFFPNTQVAEVFSNNQTFYYTDNADSLALLGYVTVSGTSLNQLNYTDAFALMRYPLAYNGSFSDVATRVYGTITGTVTHNVSADSYGTLITPKGIFDNTLRVHTQTQFADITAGGQYFNLSDDLYEWYDGIHPKPLLSIRFRQIDNNGTVSNNKFVDIADVIAPSSLADAYGYQYSSNQSSPATVCNFRDISGVGNPIVGLEDDNLAGTFQLGFPFPYYWASYDQLSVGSNGYLIMGNETFNVASNSGNFPLIPYADANNNIIAPLLCDLNFGGAGNAAEAYFYSNGVDTCIVMFKNVPFWTNNTQGFAGSNTFEVIFTAADSSITFAYADLSPRTDMNSTYRTSVAPVITGIENSNGTIGLNMAISAMPPDNSCYTFSPPNIPLIAVTDVYPQWNQNAQNGAIFLLQNEVINLNARIKNGGSVAIDDTVFVSATIIDSDGNNFGDPIVNTFVGLEQGATHDIITWADFPAIEGYYTYQVNANTNGDLNLANNNKDSEIIVVDTSSIGEMTLNYVNEANATQNTLSWLGGGNYADGAGMYVQPPYYPARIEAVEFFMVPSGSATAITSGFRAQVRDDDSSNPSNSTILFEADVAANLIQQGAWHSVATDNDTITEGGFYVSWLMEGNGIALATDQQAPFSHRNYEILNNAWSPHRNSNIEDLYMRVKMRAVHLPPIDTTVIDTSGTDTTVIDTTVAIHYLYHSEQAQLSNPQPNPAHNITTINYYLPKALPNLRLVVCDLLGRKRLEKRAIPNTKGEHSLALEVLDWQSGTYIYSLISEEQTLSGKLTIK
jgi:hypothetical protein